MFEILNRSISAINVIIALLASGFPLRDLRLLSWSDIQFMQEEDYAVAHLKKDYRGISKHDYTRPLIPDVALYLRKVYKYLCKEYGKDAVSKMKIIPDDMENSFIANEVRNVLVRAGYCGTFTTPGRPRDGEEPIPNRILQTNYQSMLISKAGLGDDPDTFSFLSGLNYKSSTFINYESHTSPDAMKRLYTILQPVSTEKRSKKKSGMMSAGEKVIYTFVPETNHEVVGVKGVITCPPGAQVKIRVSHGVTGVISCIKK